MGVVVETHGEATVLTHPLVVVQRCSKVVGLVHIGISQQVQFAIFLQMLHGIVGFVSGIHFGEGRLLHDDIIVPVLKLVALLLSHHTWSPLHVLPALSSHLKPAGSGEVFKV